MSDGNDTTRQEEPEGVNEQEDADFASAFAEFAAGSKEPAPAGQEAGDEDGSDTSEGNVPEGKEGAAEAPAEPSGDTSDQKPAGAAEAPAEAATTDIWANAPPELRAAREAMEREMASLRHAASSDRNRVSALSRKLHELTNGGQQPPEKQPEKTEAQKAVDAKITGLKEDYPEIGEALEALRASVSEELAPIKATSEAVVSASEEERISREVEALTTVHSDWREIARSEDWAAWAQAQSPGIQALAGSESAKEVSVALSLFKQEKGIATKTVEAAPGGDADTGAAKPDARRQQQLDGGRAVSSKGGSAASGPPDDFEGAFHHFTARRETTRQAGGARR